MSLGVIVASVLTIVLLGLTPPLAKFTGCEKWLAISAGVIFIKALVDILIRPSLVDLVAFLGIFIVLVAANCFASFLWKSRPKETRHVFITVSIILCILLLFATFSRISIQNYAIYPQNVFPYSEPSHFAIFCTPLIAAGIIVARIPVMILLFATILSAAFLIPNLTLAVQSLLFFTVFIGAMNRNIIALIPVFIILILAAVSITTKGVHGILPEYFMDRVSFTDAENISTLVYLQGWDRSLISLETTHGLGVGFQNLGNLAGGDYGARLFNILQFDKNLKDGGFLFAKLVGEFGVFGLLFCIAYLCVFWSAFSDLTKQLNRLIFCRPHNRWQPGYQETILGAVGNTFIVSFIIELYVRAVGYFSLGIFLFAVGLFLRSLGKNRKSPQLDVGSHS